MVDEKNHAERMKMIFENNESWATNMLCYISGYMGADPKFKEAFQDAIENGIFLD